MPGDIEKELAQITRQYKKLERDYRALAGMHEQTERLRDANEAAKELTNFYNQLLLENTPGITFMADLDMNFVLGTEKAVSFLGYSDMREMAGVPMGTLFANTLDEQWIAATEERCREVMESGKTVEYEEKVITKNNRERVFQVTITPAGQDGDCRGAVVVMNDVTELYDAREKAILASQAKGAFLANMSHEMRTPMNAIIGMTNIAMASDDPERKAYCLQKIADASSHLLAVINDVLDMSKIEANKLELSCAPFNFERAVQKAVSVINFRLEERKQDFTVDIDKNIPSPLLGDDQRLAQVITNLLSNAVKFTPEEGKVSLKAFLTGEEKGLYAIQVEIRDTGIGISPEQQARLFSSFEQADSGTSRKFGGTGLGLAISKRIIELMGGSIKVESELGKGSTFIFTIKAEKGQEETPAAAKSADPGGEAQAADTNNYAGFTILLAEDVEINREIVLSLLEPTGLTIDTAENGAAAVELFTANPEKYAMIFMDLQMPEMDGFEAARKIRALEKSQQKENAPEARKAIPIVAMTANVFKEDVEKCLEAGMNAHVGKPLDIADVMQKLREYLK
jgi:PAS domain S-box-containing protein